MLKEKFLISSAVLYSPFKDYFTDGNTGLGKGNKDWSKEVYEAKQFDSYPEALGTINKFNASIWAKDEYFQIEKVFIVEGVKSPTLN
jgi:hypothetical protein